MLHRSGPTVCERAALKELDIVVVIPDFGLSLYEFLT
jgi:hypothetical protein